MPTNRKLPIGIQTFRVIREDGHYYVDIRASLNEGRSLTPATTEALDRGGQRSTKAGV